MVTAHPAAGYGSNGSVCPTYIYCARSARAGQPLVVFEPEPERPGMPESSACPSLSGHARAAPQAQEDRAAS
jgi:hypothetical protein